MGRRVAIAIENATAEEITVAKTCSPRMEGFISFQALELLIGGYGEEEVARISSRAPEFVAFSKTATVSL